MSPQKRKRAGVTLSDYENSSDSESSALALSTAKKRKSFKTTLNLLEEKVGRQTEFLDLTAIPIKDIGGRNPRRILMEIKTVDGAPSKVRHFRYTYVLDLAISI